MNDTTYTPTSNPISLYHSGGMTESQTSAYNALLTQTAKILGNLQARITDNISLDKKADAVLCWQYILHDLSTTILPEFYVIFQDKTTSAMQRRRLYDVTQALYFALASYDTPTFLQKIALLSTHTQTLANLPELPSIKIVKPSSITVADVDSYITGTGPNVKVAYQLRAMADFVSVDGFYYLDEFQPFYTILTHEPSLLSYLKKINLTALRKNLDEAQVARYPAFAVPSSRQVLQQPILRGATVEHDLATWIRQDYLQETKPLVPVLVNAASSNQLANVESEREALISQPMQLGKGVVTIGASITLFTALASSFGVGFLLMLFLTPFMYKGAKSIVNGLNTHDYAGELLQFSIYSVLFIPFFFIFSPFITSFNMIFALQLALLSSVALFRAGNKISGNPDDKNNRRHTESNPLINNSFQQEYYQKQKEKFDAIKNTAIDVEVEEVTDTSKPIAKHDKPSTESSIHKNYDLPLTLERHGYHLAILLSDTPTEHLNQLIEATNTLYDYLDYLNEAHPYLATRVDELIKDLTDNTLVRLDEMASQFVKDGKVNDVARQLFIEQHEDRIDKLIVLNLSQVNELNHSILEKQMAGFADVGNLDERQFRNTIQELKILLRWLIAQQPDEVRASAHQVILDSLETTTLTDMQAVFFASHTTNKQREQLQHQLGQLLNHFKQQTTQDIHLHSIDQNESEISKLLQLSKASDEVIHNKKIGLTDVDNQVQQDDVQRFIDINHHYVKQLLMHWH